MGTGNEDEKDGARPMTEAYLWDRSGEPDAAIQQLETLLAEYRHQQPVPVFPAIEPVRRRQWFSWRPVPAFAMAVTVVALAAGLWLFLGRSKPVGVEVAGWDVSGVAGSPRIGSHSLTATTRMGAGEVLETDADSRAHLRAENTGQIEVDPSTRVRVLNARAGLDHIALDRGTIHAYIWAPPGQFVVDTPAATTVDLGCAYTLHVDDSGAGLLRTSMGWVGFKLNGREAFIPAGAACATRPKVGPGTPYFEDSSVQLREALMRFDFEDTTAEQRGQDLGIVLRETHRQDALTLWHLLARVDEGDRGRVFDRLAAFFPPPKGVTRAGVLQLNQGMLDVWWNRLGYDDVAVWRHWERSWSATPSSNPR